MLAASYAVRQSTRHTCSVRQSTGHTCSVRQTTGHTCSAVTSWVGACAEAAYRAKLLIRFDGVRPPVWSRKLPTETMARKPPQYRLCAHVSARPYFVQSPKTPANGANCTEAAQWGECAGLGGGANRIRTVSTVVSVTLGSVGAIPTHPRPGDIHFITLF